MPLFKCVGSHTTRKYHIFNRISNRLLVINSWKIHFQPIFQHFTAVGKVLVEKFFQRNKLKWSKITNHISNPKIWLDLPLKQYSWISNHFCDQLKNSWKYFQPLVQPETKWLETLPTKFATLTHGWNSHEN